MKPLLNLFFLAVSAAFIVVPVVAAIIYSPLWLLLLIPTFPCAVGSFLIGIMYE